MFGVNRRFSPKGFSNSGGGGGNGGQEPTAELAEQLLAHQQAMEKKRLKHLHRQFSNELQNLESEILQASMNKLRREAAERSADVSEMSDGYLSPLDDSESISSDVFGMPESKRLMPRVDENREMPNFRPSTTRAKPVTRRSISRELFDANSAQQPQQQQLQHAQPQMRKTSGARPVTRRSISRELYDVNFAPSSAQSHHHNRMAEMEAQMRQHMRSREQNLARDFDQFCMDSAAVLGDRFMPPPRQSLTSQGRSLTQNEFQRFPGHSSGSLRRAGVAEDIGSYIPIPTRGQDAFGGGMRGGGPLPSSLDERSRGDWRRISVPERGKDFKSLPRKYNR